MLTPLFSLEDALAVLRSGRRTDPDCIAGRFSMHAERNGHVTIARPNPERPKLPSDLAAMNVTLTITMRRRRARLLERFPGLARAGAARRGGATTQSTTLMRDTVVNEQT